MADPTSPFPAATPPKPRGWFDRLVRRARPDRARQALSAHLAEAFPSLPPRSALERELTGYRVIGARARKLLRTIWQTALVEFLKDDILTEAETTYLDRLANWLTLGADETRQVLAEVAHPRFGQAVAAVLEDDHVTEEERAKLRDLGRLLEIPEGEQIRLFVEQAKPRVQAVLDTAIADRRYSPDERARLEAMAKNFGVDITLDRRSAEQLERFARLWAIENGDLPVIEVPINLQKKEVCHFTCPAEWYELRTRTVRIDYAGPVGSIRIAKGLRFRVGSIAPRRVTKEELTRIDQGTLYITSKRVIFDGSRKNTTIRYASLLAVQRYADGLGLEKSSGRSPTLVLSGDTEEAAAILTTAMAL